jgi:hypothetical protein
MQRRMRPLEPIPLAGIRAARASFVDGIGGRSVLAEKWPLASTLLSGSIAVSLAERPLRPPRGMTWYGFLKLRSGGHRV